MAGSSFAGGVLTGYLLSLKGSEIQSILSGANGLNNNITKAVRSQSKRMAGRVSALQKTVGENLSEPLPDLYKATEPLVAEGVYLNIPR